MPAPGLVRGSVTRVTCVTGDGQSLRFSADVLPWKRMNPRRAGESCTYRGGIRMPPSTRIVSAFM